MSYYDHDFNMWYQRMEQERNITLMLNSVNEESLNIRYIPQTAYTDYEEKLAIYHLELENVLYETGFVLEYNKCCVPFPRPKLTRAKKIVT